MSTANSNDFSLTSPGAINTIHAKDLDFAALNRAIRQSTGNIEIFDCLGQRFIAAGMSDKIITINGIPGNALGTYLNGASIRVRGNAQDAVGKTMNEGYIVKSKAASVTPQAMPCGAAESMSGVMQATVPAFT